MKPQLHGMQRKATRKDRLRWDVYFSEPVADADRQKMVAGLRHVTASWELDRILTLVWDGTEGVTTAIFRDQVASRITEWDAVAKVVAGHLCHDGPWRESRARSRTAAGLPAYLFPMLNHGRRPARHLWQVSLLLSPSGSGVERDRLRALVEHPGMVWFRKLWFAPFVAPGWLRFKHREGIDPIPRAFAEIIADLDDALESLHEVLPVTLAHFGPTEVDASGDDWHRWSVEQPVAQGRKLPADDAFEPLHTPAAPLAPGALEALMAEARASYDHAEDQGDPGSALEGLVEVLERLPGVHAAERRQIEGWIEELARVIAT